MPGYLLDYKTLSLRYSLSAVRDALHAWRTKPGAVFFPTPPEIAADIEKAREQVAREEESARGHRETQAQLTQWERDFWAWVDSRLQDDDTQGMTEQQFLDTVRIIGYTGRTARMK